MAFRRENRADSRRDTVAVTKLADAGAMQTTRWIEFELSVTAVIPAVRVRIGDYGDRWVASVQCGTSRTSALGANARDALVAALAPLGARARTEVMAAPMMFGASAELLEARAAV